MQHYATIAAPLIELLKKESFKWNDQATSAFENHKITMKRTPMLHLPDFSKTFVVVTIKRIVDARRLSFCSFQKEIKSANEISFSLFKQIICDRGSSGKMVSIPVGETFHRSNRPTKL